MDMFQKQAKNALSDALNPGEVEWRRWPLIAAAIVYALFSIATAIRELPDAGK